MDSRYILYKCVECGSTETIGIKNNKDGRGCKKCKGQLVAIANVGLDFSNNKDTPGLKK